MKKLNSNSIEKLESAQLDQLSSITGGAAANKTSTTNKSTQTCVFDKDSKTENFCGEK